MNNRILRVGFIASSLDYGGVEKYVVELINSIDRRRFAPVVFYFDGKAPLLKSIQAETPVCRVPRKSGRDLSIFKRLATAFTENSIDIIHSNNWSTFAEAALAGRIASIPVRIHAQHGIEMNDSEAHDPLKRFLRNRLRQFFCCLIDRVVVVSEATRRFVVDEWRVADSKVCKIYNGIDQQAFLPQASEKALLRKQWGIAGGETVIGSVGRLMPVKNYGCLIEAVSLLKKMGHPVRLLLVGDGPQRTMLEQKAGELGVDGMVHFQGRQDNVRPFLGMMDIFVLPSLSEGVSIALLEAMACGLPVVATNVGGTPEVITSGENGILVEADSASALAQALAGLLTGPEQSQQLSRAGRELVSTSFTLQAMTGNYMDLYTQLYDRKQL